MRLLHVGNDHGGGRACEEEREASREEIVKHMDANVCRCGTYPRIVNAIEIAAGTAKEVAE